MALEWVKSILGDSYTDEIEKKIAAEIGKGFVSRSAFNEVNESKKTLEKDVAARDLQLEELKKIDAAGLQAKIDELQEQNKKTAEEYEGKMKAAQLNFALDAKLAKEGAVSTKAVRALLDMDKISIDGENLVGIDDQLKALRESEKWAFGAGMRTGLEHGGSGGQLSGVEKAFYAKNPQLKNTEE